MATIKLTGLDGYLAKMESLNASTKEIVGKTVYEGCGIVADSVREQLLNVPTSEYTDKKGRQRNWYGTPMYLAQGPSPEQKTALLEALGISGLQDDGGFINSRIGFGGYNDIRSAQWPNGQPNPLVARAVNSGTSFMKANPFFKEALRRSRRKAQDAMKRKAADEIRKAFWARRGK